MLKFDFNPLLKGNCFHHRKQILASLLTVTNGYISLMFDSRFLVLIIVKIGIVALNRFPVVYYTNDLRREE